MRVCASSPCSCLLKCWSWRRSAHSTASGHCRCILSTPASGLSSSGLCPPSPPYHLLSDPSARTTPGSLQLVSNSGRMLPHDESIQPSSSLLHSHSTNVNFRPLVLTPFQCMSTGSSSTRRPGGYTGHSMAGPRSLTVDSSLSSPPYK